MQPRPKTHSLLVLDEMSPPDATALLANARNLQRVAEAGQARPLLRGKNIGLLCETDDDHDAILFRRAVTSLGAHFARIRPSLSDLSTPQEVQHTARMLGRLYDAVVCQGMPTSVVQQVRKDAGVPVFDGIASWDHPTDKLAEHLGEGVADENRNFLLQAVLLTALG